MESSTCHLHQKDKAERRGISRLERPEVRALPREGCRVLLRYVHSTVFVFSCLKSPRGYVVLFPAIIEDETGICEFRTALQNRYMSSKTTSAITPSRPTHQLLGNPQPASSSDRDHDLLRAQKTSCPCFALFTKNLAQRGATRCSRSCSKKHPFFLAQRDGGTLG